MSEQTSSISRVNKIVENAIFLADFQLVKMPRNSVARDSRDKRKKSHASQPRTGTRIITQPTTNITRAIVIYGRMCRIHTSILFIIRRGTKKGSRELRSSDRVRKLRAIKRKNVFNLKTAELNEKCW